MRASRFCAFVGAIVYVVATATPCFAVDFLVGPVAAFDPAVAYSEAVLADNPVGYWRLQELSGPSAADSSGNNLVGAISGGVTLGQAGPFGGGHRAMLFNSGQIRVSDNGVSPLDVSNLTMTAWVNWNGAAGDSIIWNKENSYEGAVRNGSQLMAAIQTVNPSDGWNWTGGGTVTANDWSHVAVTYDGQFQRTYVNGILESTDDFTAHSWGDGAVLTNDLDFKIGARGGDTNSPSSPFAGLISEVAIFNGVLDQAQLQAHLDALLPPPPLTPEPSSSLLFAVVAVGAVGGRYLRRRNSAN